MSGRPTTRPDVHEREPIGLMLPDRADPALFDELLDAVGTVARHGAFILGPEVESFEAEFAAYCETRHAVGVSSGTAALTLALRALGVGPGDEVIVPGNSFIATAEAVSLAGAIPKVVDVDPGSCLLTAEIVAEQVGPATRCVIPVHLYGRTVDLAPIVALARERGIFVVEDACQAHGARCAGRRVGSIGDCGAFSFYPSKNLGAWGDGGAVVTDDPAIAARVRALRAHGELAPHGHQLQGDTARLDAVQAAVLRIKLRRLDDWNRRRRSIAGELTSALAGARIETPEPGPDDQDHVFHQYVVRSADRSRLRACLRERGIASHVHYPVPIHLTGAYRSLGLPAGSLPVVEDLAGRVCSLPIYPGMTPADVQRIGAAIQEFCPEADLDAAVGARR